VIVPKGVQRTGRRWVWLGLLCGAGTLWVGNIAWGEGTVQEHLAQRPQWTTSSRLLRLGEDIEFRFLLPEGMQAGHLDVFPRYLEQAAPGTSFSAGGPLSWVEALARETVALRFFGGQAVCRYAPAEPGSYLARWRADDETFYRYFSVVEDDSIVLRFSAFMELEPNPTLHGTGIPLDYRLPIERFRLDDPLLARLLRYHRLFGDTIIPHFPDTPGVSIDERVAAYRPGIEQVRRLLPDRADGRTIRVEMRHDLDSGYTQAFERLGINDHCGLNEANAAPWLGMPEFPYFASPVDCRKTRQETGGSVVAHQWDFCGGWHFVGPVSWHYKAAEGNWEQARRCVEQGVLELGNLAHLSGHPAFAVPLYDGISGAGYPNPQFQYQTGEPRNFAGAVREVFVVPRAMNDAEVARVTAEGLGAAGEAMGLWPLDEGRGETVSDHSGNGNDGHLVGSPTWSELEGATALRLDGEDDCVETGAPLTVPSTDLTIGCWVRPAGTQRPWANLLSSHNNGVGGAYRGFSIEQAGEATNRYYLIGGVGDRWVGTGITTQLQADIWQHLVIVRRGARLTHYLDGKVTAEGDVGDEAFAQATDGFRIGNWARGQALGEDPMRRFVEQYQRFIAFDVPKRHKVVFARSIDIADYYGRHFATTPRTVFVSKTDHLLYDMWWLCNWCNQRVLVTHRRIPWTTDIKRVQELRRREFPFKDPLSCEYVLLEDSRQSIRFERECPNPIWWFDYTRQERGPEGSGISWVDMPEVDVIRSGWRDEDGVFRMDLRMVTTERFEDYAIALWDLPKEADPEHAEVRTNAAEAVLARNTDGEYHLVLRFDLGPEAEVHVELRPTR